MSSDYIYSILSSKSHNEHHLRRYVNFILACCISNSSKTKEELGYTEDHHICPRSIWPEFSSFKINPWNKVTLTLRQHFIAHWIMARSYTVGSKSYKKTVFALVLMRNFNKLELKSRKYDSIRKMASMLDAQNKNKVLINDGTRQIYVDQNHKLEDGWTYGMTKNSKNTIVKRRTGTKTISRIEDGKIVRMIVPKADLDIFLANGWTSGRGYPKKEKQIKKREIGRIRIHIIDDENNKRTKIIRPEEFLAYETQGWKIGYGKFSESTIEKIRRPKNWVWMFDERTKESFTIHTDNIEEHLAKGLKFGRFVPKGLIWISNGKETKMVPASDLDAFINSGWRLGRKISTD